MRTTNPDFPPAMTRRFRDYLLENVYLRATEVQRSEIIALWQGEGVVRDAGERERRSHEAVFLIRAPSGELAGLSTVGLARVEAGRTFYAYRMFLRKRDRIPNLMVAVVIATREFLRDFKHPELRPAGILHVNENPKLMRPGARRLFARFGYRFWGKTADGQDVWAAEFAEPNAGTPCGMAGSREQPAAEGDALGKGF